MLGIPSSNPFIFTTHFLYIINKNRKNFTITIPCV